MNKKKLQTRLPYIFLALIIVAGLCRFSYGFFVQKQSFHADEAWSYGLANSYYKPFIQYNDSVTDFTNENEWINGDVFNDYLTVQEGEQFSFDSVYYNMSHDTHPPIYFFVLHFLSSFFPNQYIFSLGFFINMLTFIFMSIYFYKLLYLITKSKVAGVIGTAFVSFSLAMLCMTMYVRMYMLSATLALIFTYVNAKLFSAAENEKKKSSYITLLFISIIGILTDNFFLPYAFSISLIMCIFAATKKKWRTLITYSATMLLSVCVSTLIFPYTLARMFSMIPLSSRGSSTNSNATSTVSVSAHRYMPIYFQFKLALTYINLDVFGLELISPFYSPVLSYAICIAIVLLLVTIAVSFIFRNDSWFVNLRLKISNKAKETLRSLLGNFNFYFAVSLVFSILLICSTTSIITDMYTSGRFNDRYLMVCFPAALMLFVLFFWKISNFIFRKMAKFNYLFFVLILGVSTILSNSVSCQYFMDDYDTTIQLEDISEDSNFIIISSNTWILVQYSAKLLGCNDVFFTTYQNFDSYIDEIESHDFTGDTYIIIDTRIYDDAPSTAREAITPMPPSSAVSSTKGEDCTFYSTYTKCANLSMVNNLDYVGRDCINGYYLEIYKVE